MVPLKGENRILVKYGKIVLEKTRRAGLKKIIENSRLNKRNITADDVAFMIGPRINAASRLEHPKIAFKALSENNGNGVTAAEELEKINNRRKYILAKVMKNVWQRLRKRNLGDVIVIGDKTWPVGILGLISGRIADKFRVPVFVWTTSEDGKIKGSCRSGGKIDIYSLMDKTKKEFLGFDLGVAITGNEEKGITLVVTEGFGKIQMAEKTYGLLKAAEGRKTSINGATQIRAGVIRPEVVIPVADADISEQKKDKKSGGMKIGGLVRIIRQPHFGAVAKVVSLPEKPVKIPSEAKVRVVEIETLEGKEKYILPRANVEIIEE